jgi:hypothetical protein
MTTATRLNAAEQLAAIKDGAALILTDTQLDRLQFGGNIASVNMPGWNTGTYLVFSADLFDRIGSSLSTGVCTIQPAGQRGEQKDLGDPTSAAEYARAIFHVAFGKRRQVLFVWRESDGQAALIEYC